MVIFPIVNGTQREIIGVAVAFIVLPCVAVALRVYGRHLKGVPFDRSDYLIFCGLFAGYLMYAPKQSTAKAALTVSRGVVHCGVGHHLADIVQEHGTAPVQQLMKNLVGIQILWAVGNSCVKLSLLSFYCRIFPFPNFILVAKATAGFILLWAVAVILGGFLLCQPFAYTWDQTIPGGHCGNQVLSYQITGALNLVTDLMVLAMPMRHLWKLEMRPSQKIPLMCAFAVGLFVCVATIMRLVSLSSLDFTDLTSNIPAAMIWGTIEPALGVTLSCIPFMKPVFPFTRSTSRYYAQSSRTTNGQPMPFRKKGFQHPYDPYPLETFVSAAGGGGGGGEEADHDPSPPRSVGNDSDQQDLVAGSRKERAKGLSIVVQRDFEMS